MDQMDKILEVQKQVRQNVNVLGNYMTDLQNWELEMKRKEAAIQGKFEQDLPPVRSKIKKDKPITVKKPPERRIASNDYKAWDQFDVDKACENIDMEAIGPTSLDSKKSLEVKKEKMREEAQYEKQKGNNFVKQEKWDEAIKCYTRAIELVKDDPIYYANRGLCYLKKDNLHNAEKDCSEALKLDPTYVKALQRRATAREKLGSLKAAAKDFTEIIRLEPNNSAAKEQLQRITTRMGTKGANSKSSPSPNEDRTILDGVKSNGHLAASKLKKETAIKPEKKMTELEKWEHGIGEDVTIVKTLNKPPHLRSKMPLRAVPIKEIKLGDGEDKRATRMKIIEIENELDHKEKSELKETDCEMINGKGDHVNEESKRIIDNTKCYNEKMVKDIGSTEKVKMTVPVNSVQFITDWKDMKGNDAAKSDYLSMIDPSRIPLIFTNTLEINVLSDIIHLLHNNTNKYPEKSVSAYLKAFAKVKRFSTLIMFLTSEDRTMLTNLLKHCKSIEKCTDEELEDLKNKYEL